MTCRSCGAAHRWSELPLLGVQRVEADEDGPELELELRNCTACHTTLARELAPDARQDDEPDA